MIHQVLIFCKWRPYADVSMHFIVIGFRNITITPWTTKRQVTVIGFMQRMIALSITICVPKTIIASIIRVFGVDHMRRNIRQQPCVVAFCRWINAWHLVLLYLDFISFYRSGVIGEFLAGNPFWLICFPWCWRFEFRRPSLIFIPHNLWLNLWHIINSWIWLRPSSWIQFSWCVFL